MAANAIVAFLSLTNLFLVAAGAINVDVPGADDLQYEYDLANRSLLVDTSFSVINNGIYAVKHLSIDSVLVTNTGFTLMEYSRNDLRVGPGEERTFPVHVDMDLSRLVSPEMLVFLVEDGTFQLHVKVRADYTLGLTQFRSDQTIEYSWESPLGHMRDLLLEGNLTGAIADALGQAGPALRGLISGVVLDGSLAEGEWRHQDLNGWADVAYRLDLDEEAGTGAFEAQLTATVAGFQWHMNGSVPLVMVDGQVYLAQELM